MLCDPSDIGRFRDAATPGAEADRWFAATFEAPLPVVPCSSKAAYLERYAQPDKGFTDRSDSWWPAPFWDIDTGFASTLVLLTAVDHGLGGCFFGLPTTRVDAVRDAFGIPSDMKPIGAVTIGYPDEPARDLRDRRKPFHDVVHRGRWSR